MKKNKLDHNLYCITAEEHSLGRSNIEVVKEMLDAGVKIIQYREKEKSKLEKYKQCIELRRMTRAANATFIVNDDIDIALAVQADGIHIGQDDLPLETARLLVGNKIIIGVSTHNPMQAQEAVKKGADYIGVGPIYSTNTKKNVCSPVGLKYLDFAAHHIKIPFVAIGGIKIQNLSEIISHGAKCVSMVTEITKAPNIKNCISEIHQILRITN